MEKIYLEKKKKQLSSMAHDLHSTMVNRNSMVADYSLYAKENEQSVFSIVF